MDDVDLDLSFVVAPNGHGREAGLATTGNVAFSLVRCSSASSGVF